jgi:hypothetical protein
MGQTEQLVEALREAEMGKALAQPVPAAIFFRRLLHGGQQRREIEIGGERDIDPTSGNPARPVASRRWRPRAHLEARRQSWPGLGS